MSSSFILSRLFALLLIVTALFYRPVGRGRHVGCDIIPYVNMVIGLVALFVPIAASFLLGAIGFGSESAYLRWSRRVH